MNSFGSESFGSNAMYFISHTIEAYFVILWLAVPKIYILDRSVNFVNF